MEGIAYHYNKSPLVSDWQANISLVSAVLDDMMEIEE